MRTGAIFVLPIAFRLIVTSGTAAKVIGAVFTRQHEVDDMSFTDDSVFLSPAASLLACANFCGLDPSCLTFTFCRKSGTCQGHNTTSLSPSISYTVTSGARSYIKYIDPLDCNSDSVFTLNVPSLNISTQVACKDHWIVILRRQDGSVDFYRDWSQYRAGFGDVTGEYWIGLETLYKLTNSQVFQLTVDLEDWEGNSINAVYSNFSIGPESDFYRLTAAEFIGGAANDSLDYHLGYQFSTFDADHDSRATKNCAERLHGAWWYISCAKSNLFGLFRNSSEAPKKDGISWKSWTGINTYSMKSALMRIRPAAGAPELIAT